MLIVYLLAHSPHVLVQKQLILELLLPLDELFANAVLVDLETFDLLKFARPHLLTPHGVFLVQVSEELPLCLLKCLLSPKQTLVVRVVLKSVVDLS